MPFNTSRKPFPPPKDDPNSEAPPPPVPDRPASRKPVNVVNNSLPTPPDGVPPALPQRPGRNNPPPLPEPEPNYEPEDYEDMASPIISLQPTRPKPLASSTAPSSQLNRANVGQRSMPPVPPAKPKSGLRTWGSFRETGTKPINNFNHSSRANCKSQLLPWNDDEKRHVTRGAMNRPESDMQRSMPPVPPAKPKSGLRTWESFNHPSSAKYKSQSQPWNDDKKRRVTLGHMNRPKPDMLNDDDEPTDYEIPETPVERPSSNSKSGFNLQSRPQSQSRAPQNGDELYEESFWSDSEWSDPDNGSGDEPEQDELYVIPGDGEQHMCEDDGDEEYIQPSPAPPEIVPISKPKQSSQGMPLINTADLQIRRMNLSSTSSHTSDPSSPPPPPPPGKDKKATSGISAITKKFQDKILSSKDKDKPPPPPKPKVTAVTPPSSTTATKVVNSSNKTKTTTDNGATAQNTESKKEKDKKHRNSSDNSSAGSVSSTKGAPTTTPDKPKKEKLPMLPRLTTASSASAIKVPTFPLDVVHDLKNRIQSPSSEKEFNVSEKQTSCTSPTKPARLQLQPPPPADVAAAPGPDDIYDDAMSVSTENLTVYDWFHGDINRKEGDRRVQSVGTVGTFLIRTSSGNNTKPSDGNRYPYTLVIKTQAEVKNLRIRQRHDGQYAIGISERADETAFPHLYDLVDYHRTNRVKIFRQEVQDGQEQAEFIELVKSPKKP